MNPSASFRRFLSEPLRGNLTLLGAVLVGAALRAYQLPGQILVDDEWHALHKAIHSSYAEILTSFGAADHAIPITLYYKLATDTVGLSERIDEALKLLPLEQRQAFYMREELTCSIKDIAMIQGCTQEAAKSRLRYAYARLRSSLSDLVV